MKLSKKNPTGTSYHDVNIVTTVAALKKAIGEPQIDNNGMREKSNFDWICETEDGTVFTVYDWKEYRRLSETETVRFHIGANSKYDSEKALVELTAALAR